MSLSTGDFVRMAVIQPRDLSPKITEQLAAYLNGAIAEVAEVYGDSVYLKGKSVHLGYDIRRFEKVTK